MVKRNGNRNSQAMNGAPRSGARGERRTDAHNRVRALERELAELAHELETYREETRVQTQQLLEARDQLEQSRNSYVELFDFAPVPYLILDNCGVIKNVNLTGATLLKHERARLIGAPLRSFVARDDRWAMLEHMRRCCAETGRVETDLRLLTGMSEAVRVQLASRRTVEAGYNGIVFPTTVVDLTQRDLAAAARNVLLQRMMSASEEERRRISRDLHDQLGQHITALMLGLRAMENSIGDSALVGQARRLLTIAEELGRDAHRVALNLRPMALDDLGLYSALASYIDEWKRRSGIRVHYNVTADADKRLPEDVETVLYRAVQEALTNVFKHAQARQVSVVLGANDGEVMAVIEDDGRGFDAQFAFEAAAKAQRLGLLGLRERVQLVGGSIAIESVRGRGTTVYVRIPIRVPNKRSASF
jgi:signal transduction histidine kinase